MVFCHAISGPMCLEDMSKALVNVAFPLPLKQAFSYAVPAELQSTIQIGSRVVAPFGPRMMTGFVTEFPARVEIQELKEIQDVLDIEPAIIPEIFELCQWLSEYYLCSPGEAFRVSVPASLLRASRQYVQVVTADPGGEAALLEKSAPRQAQILRYLGRVQRISVAELKRRMGARGLLSSIAQLHQRSLVSVDQLFSRSTIKPKVVKFVALKRTKPEKDFAEVAAALLARAPVQAACIRHLLESGGKALRKDLLQQCHASLSTLNSLVGKELIEFTEKVELRDYYGATTGAPPARIKLNSEQEAALQTIRPAIERQRFKTFLLLGVTGSGKTQVYIEAIAQTLRAGRDAIVLVPEISLTPQTVHRFRAYFRDQVAVLHSAMSDGERQDSWLKIKDGGARVVIGPRSAIFAPVRNLGLVVVDEEHESSYKQVDSAPRYHARDVAVVRAKLANAGVILGSATPSAESYHNARSGKYSLIELTKRVNDIALPQVTIVDMRKERRMSGTREELIFSRLLAAKIDEKIALREQIILLLNRRGFSSYLKCRDCGFVEECEQCDITMTYHLSGRRLRCHYCGFSKQAPSACAICGGSDILFQGLGTQRVENALHEKFPRARIVRMDQDTTSGKMSHDRILSDFGKGRFDILLGTQMVAKGLDFSRVTLVGVINADIGMLIPDFRSSERTFQLLTQVAGRAGRKDLEGEVVIQSYSPDNFCLECAQSHDFKKFYSEEIVDRHKLNYPPFGRAVCIHFRGEDEQLVESAANEYAYLLKTISGPFQVLGPGPSPVARVKNNYRYQILLKSDRSKDGSGQKTRDALKKGLAYFESKPKFKGVRVTVDVDPASNA